MTTIVKSLNENVISIPAWLMQVLNLREGDKVKAVVEGETLRLTRLEQFLALRGALSEDESFDQAMEFINQAWQRRHTRLTS